MALPDSGDVARMRRIIARVRSYGVEVREMPGWETRGFRFPAVPTRIFDHHDASSRKSGEWGSLGLILDGTARGIPGPLSNFQVARCLDGKPRLAVVAAGYTYHAGAGGPLNELPRDNANPHTYGTEKANDGLGEPYTDAANYAANALFHAAAVESGSIPESFPVGHKEWTARKSDPLYSMADRRRQVGAFSPRTASPLQEAHRMYLIQSPGRGIAAIGANYFHSVSEEELPVALAILGKPFVGNDRQFDLARALATSPPALPPAEIGVVDISTALDYAKVGQAVADELDRRARDGNPATGPLS